MEHLRPWQTAGRHRNASSLIDGRWTLTVMAELQDRGRCDQELDDAPNSVSHKVLTDTLQRAERDGLVVRHLDPGRVETATLYQLTTSVDRSKSSSPLSNDGVKPTGAHVGGRADAGANGATRPDFARWVNSNGPNVEVATRAGTDGAT